MRRIVTVAGVAGLVLLGASSSGAQTDGLAAAVTAPPAGATQPAPSLEETPAPTSRPGGNRTMGTMGQGKSFSLPSGDEPGDMAGRSDEAFVACAGCSAVSAPLMKQAAEVLQYLTDNQTLPASLVRLSSADIDALLRGKSWTSAVLTGPFGKEYQRLLAFDADGRARWLNFHGGIKGYSTLCRYEVDEDLLCRSCPGVGPAQCSAIYRNGDLVMAYDEEQGQLEVFDWILPSRWENDRFLAPH